MHRGLGAYLSTRDQVQQAIRMVEAENIADEHGVPFLIVYGISGNTHRFWSIANAREKIGYEPRGRQPGQLRRQDRRHRPRGQALAAAHRRVQCRARVTAI